MRPRLVIVGAGMGDPLLLTAAGQAAIAEGRRVFAAPRLAENLRTLNADICSATVSDIKAALVAEETDTVVAVSGDAGFYSLSTVLARELKTTYGIEICNGINSLQYLCGKLNIPYGAVKVTSLHGRPGSAAGPVSFHRHSFFLTGGKQRLSGILAGLCGVGLGQLTATVGARLSHPDELVRTASIEELCGQEFAEPGVLLVENPHPCDRWARLRDDDFVRGAVPMTKEAVRTLAVARLEVAPTDTVWDIGAGTGSVSVALARAACDGMVWAVERLPEAVSLIGENRAKFGAHNIAVVTADAPDGLADLPAPDKVFVGGSRGRLADILAVATAKSSRFDLCVTAITLESVGATLKELETLGFTETDVQCINVAEAKAVGGYHMMLAQNPVYILSGRWQNGR